LVAHGVGEGDPHLGLLGPLATELFSGFPQFDEAAGGTEDAGAQEIQREAFVSLATSDRDSAKGFIVHSQSTISLQLLLQFSGVIHWSY
jgi:hypothetical protein